MEEETQSCKSPILLSPLQSPAPSPPILSCSLGLGWSNHGTLTGSRRSGNSNVFTFRGFTFLELGLQSLDFSANGKDIVFV